MNGKQTWCCNIIIFNLTVGSQVFVLRGFINYTYVAFVLLGYDIYHKKNEKKDWEVKIYNLKLRELLNLNLRDCRELGQQLNLDVGSTGPSRDVESTSR